METLKKIFDFILLCIFILAGIGGTAYLLHDGHTLFGITNIILVCMAIPFFKDIIKDIER